VYRKLRSLSAAIFFAKYPKNYSFDPNTNIRWEKDKLVLPDYSISFTKPEINLFHRSLSNIIDTVKKFKIEKTNEAFFLYSASNSIPIKFKISFFDSINALNEIFLEGLYYFQSRRSFVVMDIGMNVGVASLYFATLINSKKIYGYEPFRSTFDMALENFKLNPSISQKIIAHNYGLGDKTSDVEVPFSSPGFMGASTTSSFIEEQQKILNLGTRKALVHLKSISEELIKVLSENEGEALFVKIDCEGAEFEIVEHLKTNGLLEKISLAIIEWHFRDKFQIIHSLEDAGFLVFSQDREQGSPMGMIYAVNRDNMI
jgi:FkbM family methyltransferase